MSMDTVHGLVVATIIAGIILGLWWVGNDKRRKYMAAQTAFLLEQTEASKRNADYLAASGMRTQKQNEILERIARALESHSPPP